MIHYYDREFSYRNEDEIPLKGEKDGEPDGRRVEHRREELVHVEVALAPELGRAYICRSAVMRNSNCFAHENFLRKRCQSWQGASPWRVSLIHAVEVPSFCWNN